MTPGSRRLENPDEVLSDVVSLCAKVWNDNEKLGRVHTDDLVELRDRINDIRGHVAGGGGYASLPRLIKPGKDE
jgi:hypothetical protein